MLSLWSWLLLLSLSLVCIYVWLYVQYLYTKNGCVCVKDIYLNICIYTVYTYINIVVRTIHYPDLPGLSHTGVAFHGSSRFPGSPQLAAASTGAGATSSTTSKAQPLKLRPGWGRGDFINGGIPIAGWFFWVENPWKSHEHMDDLWEIPWRYPHNWLVFVETPMKIDDVGVPFQDTSISLGPSGSKHCLRWI